MASPKKYFQLVNYEGQNPLEILFGDSTSNPEDWRYCDWDLDGNGKLKVIRDQDAVVQTTLKNVFTEKQPNGLGTNIYSLIGEKDILVRRGSLFMDISMAILAKKLLIDEQAEKQNLEGNDLINTMGKLVVTEDPSDPTKSKVQMSIRTQSTTDVPISVV